MNHAELQAHVIASCGARRLHVHHCPMLASSPGFPDLVIIGRSGVLWRELKVPPDTLTGAQRALGYALEASGQDWATWIPEDWESGRVAGELEQIR